MACLPTVINNIQVCLEFVQPTSQVQGLVGKKSIPDNYGLVYDVRPIGKKKVAFFNMAGVKFPTDIIFIRNNKIQLINYNVQGCSKPEKKCPVYGGFPVDYVIQTKAGNADKWKLDLYQKFVIKFNNSK